MKEWRFYLVSLVIFLLISGIFARLFQIQVLKYRFYSALAQNQHQLLQSLIPERGEIFMQDKDGSATSYVPLAVNKIFQAAYLVPREFEALDDEVKTEAAFSLSEILAIDKEEILTKINKKKDPYEPLKDKLDEAIVNKIKSLNLKGVYFAPQTWRWYPQLNIASHLMGFIGFKDQQRVGQYGLEEFYEIDLAGRGGFLKGKKDAFGRPILSDIDNFDPAEDGKDFVLTIDRNVQFMAEEKLRDVMEKWQAESGTIIIEDPKTGAIKAMANFPNFNPNEYAKEKDINVFLNSAVQKMFEPGSVFKLITMAAGLDSGKVTPETTYVDEGVISIGGYTITNAKNRKYGLSSMTRVLEKSINTGAVFAERAIGHEIFKNYVEAFGFGQLAKIDLGGEAAGNIGNLDTGREINYATASFGQGVAVTPIQMLAAVSAIANEGKMMKPYLVEKKIGPDGSESVIGPQISRQPISAQTAAKLTAMMVSTVRQGYDKIKIKGYFVAGKTGTAQIPDLERGGYSDQTIHSFVGFAPAYNPKFIIFIKMDKPRGINFASDSLSPVFADLAKFLLAYYEIPPEE